jgi:hypothetical protein
MAAAGHSFGPGRRQGVDKNRTPKKSFVACKNGATRRWSTTHNGMTVCFRVLGHMWVLYMMGVDSGAFLHS